MTGLVSTVGFIQRQCTTTSSWQGLLKGCSGLKSIQIMLYASSTESSLSSDKVDFVWSQCSWTCAGLCSAVTDLDPRWASWTVSNKSVNKSRRICYNCQSSSSSSLMAISHCAVANPMVWGLTASSLSQSPSCWAPKVWPATESWPSVKSLGGCANSSSF